jgi:flagellar basal body-associated protein FliL
MRQHCATDVWFWLLFFQEPLMATAKASTKRSGAFSDWKLGLIVGLSVCIMGVLAWRYAGQGEAGSPQRPVPVWLGVSKLTSQLENGQVLAFKVDLQVKQKDDLEVLAPHVPALETMIQELGQSMSKEDLSAEDGLAEFGRDIKRSVNNYLRKQRVEPRVVMVAFEDIFLNP